MKWNHQIFILCLITMVWLLPVQVASQERSDSLSRSTDSETVVSNQTLDKPAKSFSPGELKHGISGKTVLELLYLCQEIGYLLALVFILGILFIFQQWYVLIRERKDAQRIPIDGLKSLDYGDIESMFTKLQDQKSFSIDDNEKPERVPLLRKIFRRRKSSAFQLLYKLYKVFEIQWTTKSFGEEISSFKQYMKDMFNPFLTRLSFFSDTAGGLGLLGTVWGMFLVFYRGTPEQSEVLSGMGIALATTIIGLVISIILNSFTTVVSNIFDQHLDRLDKMANIFTERLMKEEAKSPKTVQPIQIISQVAAQPMIEPQPVPIMPTTAKKVEKIDELIQEPPVVIETYGPPAKIRVLSGDNQVAEVNTQLPDPIIVEVRDQDDHLLENETVIFTAENGAGTFPNHSRIHKILTDEEGRAQTQLLLGKDAGEKTIQIATERNSQCRITLLIIARPTPPEKFIELKGNYQTGELDKRLREPFVVAIKDRYDNPIARYEVAFHLKKGSGKFQDSQNSEYTTHTNEDGLAEVYFIMGNNRGAREIEADAKKVEPSKIRFEVFAI